MRIRRYVERLDRYKYVFVAILTLAVGVMSLSLKNIAFEGGYKIWFAKDSNALEAYEKFRTTFGGDDSFIIAFEDDETIFTVRAIQTVIELTKKLETLEGVRKVDSLTNYQYIDAQDDDIVVEDFIVDTEKLLEKKKIALKDPLIVGHLLSYDAKTTMLVVHLNSQIGADDAVSVHLFKRIEEITQAMTQKTGYDFYVTGIAAVTASLVHIAVEDMIKILPVAMGATVIFLFVLFRNVWSVLVLASVVVYTILIVVSTQILLGYELNNFTVNIPGFLTAIAVAGTMHLYTAWIFYRHKGAETKEALVLALETNLFAIALTSFTTAIGFVSLGLSTIVPLQSFGIAITSGSLIAFALSVTLAPALILMQNDRTIPKISMFDFIRIRGYGAFIVKYEKAIVRFFALGFLLGSAGIAFVSIDSTSVKYFDEETAVRKGVDFVERRLSGSMVYEVVIDSGKKEGIKEAAFLREVEKFTRYIRRTYPRIRYSYSIYDVVKRLQEVLDPQATTPIPNDRNLTAQYLLLYSMSLPQGEEINEYIDVNERYVRVSLSANVASSSQDLELVDAIQRYWEGSPYSATVSGQTAIFASMQRDLTMTLFTSIAVTIAMVSALMIGLFKNSANVSVFLLPNIAPLVFVGGVMGYAGIVADIGVAVSVAVILGIAIDDTIHFFTKYFNARRTRDFPEAIDHVMRHSGSAMIMTTVLLSLTFSVFGLSRFEPNVSFAIITVVALNVALLLDLVLLPALLYRQEKRKNNRT